MGVCVIVFVGVRVWLLVCDGVVVGEEVIVLEGVFVGVVEF